MAIKGRKENKMKTDTHGNGNELNDLYILPESNEEESKIIECLEKHGLGYQFSYGNVKGHEWYGKKFIEVPFCENWLEIIKKEITK